MLNGLSEHDRLLEIELNSCRDAARCYEIADAAESDVLAIEANYKSIRLYNESQYWK